MNNKKKVLIAALVAVALIVSIGGTLLLTGGASGRERSNMLALAREYIDRGDYDRALDLLDRLIIRDVNDEDARALRDEALGRKSGAAASQGQASGQASADSQALAQSLDQLGKSLERTASTVASSGAGTKPAAGSGFDADASAAARKAEEDARAKAEAEAEAARKRAQDAALAKTSAELRAKMEAVNALVKAGRSASSSGDYPKAKSNFDQATGMLPEGEPKFASQTWSDVAEGYYDGYKLDPVSSGGIESIKQAQRAAQEAIRAAPTDPATARPHYTLSKIYNDSRMPDLAVTELEQAVKLDPNDYLYAVELGKAYFAVKKFEEAKRAFESVTTKLNPKYEPAFYYLGMTQRALNNTTAALAAFRRATDLKPDYVNAHLQTGIVLKARNDLAGAVKSFNTALSFDDRNVSALRNLGETFVAQGKPADAERSFERALAIAADATTNYNLAKVKYDLGKYAEALPFARKAVELSPSTSIFQYQVGLCAEKTGDVDAAIISYAKSADLDRTAVDPRTNLGKIYLESGFIDKALDILDQAYRIDSKSFEANNNLGNAYKAKGVYDKSVFHYERALVLAPRDPTILLNLAKAYVLAGDLTKARDTYIELIKLDPSSWEAMHELGKVYLSLKDNAAARKVLTELVARKPDYSKRGEVDAILAGL
ncbi:MAG: tetratricopeptide repeat protein [Spirochaetales bacterium]|nr:MAG: tetratricopeptide repeat protein [Spirochaetales bacterium]